MKYKFIKKEGYYSSVIPYRDGLIKGGHYNHNYDLHYNNHFINSNVDTAPGIARLYDNLLFYSSNSKGYCFNLDTFENRALNESIIFSTYQDNSFLSLKNLDKNDWSYELCLYQFEPEKILHNILNRHLGSIYRFGKLVINLCRNANSIILRSLSLLTGEYEWEVDLGGRFYDFHGERKEADIQNVIGVWQDWLLVSLSNHTLIALETSTGKIVWEQIPWAGYPSLKGGLAMPVLEKDSLFWYSYNAYFEFHLPTQKGILHQEYPHTDKSMPPFYIQRSVFLGDYVYFIASHKSYILNNIVGVFNRKTLQIDWQEEMDILPPQKQSDIFLSLTQIQATADKIYVLDSGGTLHIFEREE